MRISDWSSDVCSSDLITSGLGKWLYRAARKHAGGNGAEGFTIGFQTLHQKSGSESSYPVFKKMLLELAKANALPDIALEAQLDGTGERSEERRVGTECVSTCRSRWAPYH